MQDAHHLSCTNRCPCITKTGKLHKIFGFSWKGATSATLGSVRLVILFHRDRFVSLSTGNLDTVWKINLKVQCSPSCKGRHPHELDVFLAKVPNQPLVLSVGRAGPCVAIWSMHRGDLSKVLRTSDTKLPKFGFQIPENMPACKPMVYYQIRNNGYGILKIPVLLHDLGLETIYFLGTQMFHLSETLLFPILKRKTTGVSITDRNLNFQPQFNKLMVKILNGVRS